MSKKELEAALNELIQELDKIDNADEQTKESLQRLVDSIQSLLREPESKEQHSQVLGKLKDETIQFEVEHPLISSKLEEMIDILVKLGL